MPVVAQRCKQHPWAAQRTLERIQFTFREIPAWGPVSPEALDEGKVVERHGGFCEWQLEIKHIPGAPLLRRAGHQALGECRPIGHGQGDELRELLRGHGRGCMCCRRTPVVADKDHRLVAERSGQRDCILGQRGNAKIGPLRNLGRCVATHIGHDHSIAGCSQSRHLVSIRARVIRKAVQCENRLPLTRLQIVKRDAVGLHDSGEKEPAHG